MTLSLLHPDAFDLPTLANLIGEPEVFADWLTDPGCCRLPMYLLAEQMADVLLLYARDMLTTEGWHLMRCEVCGKEMPWHELSEAIVGVMCPPPCIGRRVNIGNPYRLFPLPFTEAALAAWLRRVGDYAQAEIISQMRVSAIATFIDPQRTRYSAVRTQMQGDFLHAIIFNENGFATQREAELDCKWRVLGMFGEVGRTVDVEATMREAALAVAQDGEVWVKTINPETYVIRKRFRPIDFLPSERSRLDVTHAASQGPEYIDG